MKPNVHTKSLKSNGNGTHPKNNGNGTHPKSNGSGAHSNGKRPSHPASNGAVVATNGANGASTQAAGSNGPTRFPISAYRKDHVAMKSAGEEALRVLASSIARLVSKGKQTILITSSGPGEGKSTITAALARKLARSGRLSVALIDADTMRPKLHTLFELDNRRGLGELLDDVYHVDLKEENPDQFGVGDWIELIRAQGRTGKLQVSEGGQEFSIIFNKGKVSSISDHTGQAQSLLGAMLVAQGRITEAQCASALRVQEEGSHPLGQVLQGLGYLEAGDLDLVLSLQLQQRLHKILTLRQPRYRFAEMVEAYLPAAASTPAHDPNGSGIDRHVAGTAGDYLKQPYLSSQVPGYLKDSQMENLKVLTCGERFVDLSDAHFASPFRMVIDRIAKRFDVVLIDSPPVAFDSPTASLARTVDGVVLVVKSDSLNVGVIQQAKEQLVRSGATMLGVVLNQVDLSKDEALPYYHRAYR